MLFASAKDILVIDFAFCMKVPYRMESVIRTVGKLDDCPDVTIHIILYVGVVVKEF